MKKNDNKNNFQKKDENPKGFGKKLREVLGTDIFYLLKYLIKTEWKFIVFLFLYCIAMNHFESINFISEYLKVPVFSIGALGGGIGILLGFRFKTSYDRWWEARKLWGDLINNSRIWGRLVIASLKPALEKAESKEKEDLISVQERLLELQKFFIVETVCWLQPAVAQSKEVVAGIKRYQFFGNEQHKPYLLVMQQEKLIAKVVSRNWINGFQYLKLSKSLDENINKLGGCERIKNTPFSGHYKDIFRIMVRLYSIMLPLSLLELHSYLMPIIITINFMFFELLLIGAARTDVPFGRRSTDHNMENFAKIIITNLEEAFAYQTPQKMRTKQEVQKKTVS